MGVLLLVTAGVLILARNAVGIKGCRDLGVREATITGFAQALGVLPGISRSEITVSGSLFARLKREQAGEYTLLLALLFLLRLVGDIGTLALQHDGEKGVAGSQRQ